MQKDHLSLMGVQAWQARNVVKLEAVSSSTNEQLLEVQSEVKSGTPESKDSIKNKAADQVADKAADSTEDQVQSISAYAAISQRQGSSGNSQRWLWIAPQSSLPAVQLQLLDKIVTATGSHWESVGIADNYVHNKELNSFLQEPLSAVVILAKSLEWDGFYSSELFQRKRYFIGTELDELLNDPDKKRQVWQLLQQLMDDD